jgi:hypothetical protein
MAAVQAPWPTRAWAFSDTADSKAWARQASHSYSDQVLPAGHMNALRYRQRRVRGHDMAAEAKARRDNLRIHTRSSRMDSNRTGSSHTRSSSPTEEAESSAAICGAQDPPAAHEFEAIHVTVLPGFASLPTVRGARGSPPPPGPRHPRRSGSACPAGRQVQTPAEAFARMPIPPILATSGRRR